MVVGVEGAAAQLQRAVAIAAVDADVGRVHVARRAARRDFEVRVGVAAGDAEPNFARKRRVRAEDEAADGVGDRRRVAVAADVAPGVEPLPQAENAVAGVENS